VSHLNRIWDIFLYEGTSCFLPLPNCLILPNRNRCSPLIPCRPRSGCMYPISNHGSHLRSRRDSHSFPAKDEWVTSQPGRFRRPCVLRQAKRRRREEIARQDGGPSQTPSAGASSVGVNLLTPDSIHILLTHTISSPYLLYCCCTYVIPIYRPATRQDPIVSFA
jgi:hypothetical protein